MYMSMVVTWRGELTAYVTCRRQGPPFIFIVDVARRSMLADTMTENGLLAVCHSAFQTRLKVEELTV